VQGESISTRFKDFDNSRIESMIGAEEFTKIRTERKGPVRKTALHYTHSPAKVSGVASRQARYHKEAAGHAALRGESR
jgi:hypothetical protein